jgi:hypothetical protein
VSFATFTLVQAGETADAAFQAARDDARAVHGDRPGQTGTIADLLDVDVVRAAPTPLRRAERLADTHGYGDAATAYAIRLAVGLGEPASWFLFGKAHY